MTLLVASRKSTLYPAVVPLPDSVPKPLPSTMKPEPALPLAVAAPFMSVTAGTGGGGALLPPPPPHPCRTAQVNATRGLSLIEVRHTFRKPIPESLFRVVAVLRRVDAGAQLQTSALQ